MCAPHLHSCHPCGISRLLIVAEHMHITFDSCSIELQPRFPYEFHKALMKRPDNALACSRCARSTARAGAACDIHKRKAVVSVRGC